MVSRQGNHHLDCDNVADQGADLTDGGVKLLSRLTSRGNWAIPVEAFEKIPTRIWERLEKLDPDKDAHKFDKCVRLLARLQDQNLARDRAEIQFYGPQAVQGPITPETAETSPAPQIGYQERPTLSDASATLKVLDDLGILGDIAQGTAQRGDVIDADSTPVDDEP